MKIGKISKEEFLFTLENKEECADCKYYFNGTTCVFSENPPSGVQLYSTMDNCLCSQWSGNSPSGSFFEACCRTNPGPWPECPPSSSSSNS